MVKDYGLSFISNEDLFFHVKETIESTSFGKVTLTKLENSGAFHQSLLKSITNNKQHRSTGFDLIDEQKKIFTEIKNKCPSMNAFSARKTYTRYQSRCMFQSA